MTGRSRWILLIAIVGTWIGLVRYQPVLSLLSISVFLWVLIEWLRFAIRCKFELASIRVERRVNGQTKPKDILWAGRKVDIQVHLRSRLGIRRGIDVRDLVPENMALLSEIPGTSLEDSTRSKKPRLFTRLWRAATQSGPSTSEKSPQEYRTESNGPEFQYTYRLRPRAAGRVCFPGLRLTMQDRYGFFRQHRFVDCEQSFSILPDYYHGGERESTVKRFNSLPRHGIHRLQRAGLGSELLELREYVPGDPPKSIAWKVSARRDTLMTRQYESEVPVRVNFLIDGAVSTRIGGFGVRLLDQFNFVAASLAKASLSVGDPVSATLVDERGARHLRPFSGDRGFLQFLKALSDFSDAPPPPSRWLTPMMVLYAQRTLNERYPELLVKRYQSIPFSFSKKRRERYRLVAALGQLFSLDAQTHVECCFDDAKLAIQIRRLLHEAGRPWMAPFVIEPPGSQSSPANLRLIAKEMSRSLVTAKDNEVFVVLADLLSCASHLDEIMKVVKLALARHHRVAFVCPSNTFLRPANSIVRPNSDSIADLLFAAEQTRARDFSTLIKRKMGRLGVAVSFAGEESAIRMIISEIEMARDGRRVPQGARS